MKLLDQTAVSIRFRRFILTVVVSVALGTVISLDQWNGGSHNAFGIGSTVFAQWDAPQSAPALTLNGGSVAISVAAGAAVTVGVQGGPVPAAGEWIGLYASGATDTTNIQWYYFQGPPLRFTLPSTPGSYEFRFFQYNGYTKLATSPTITVTSTLPPPPPTAPLVSSVSVNGGSAPITILPGATLTVGVQNGGTATAWAALYKTTDPNYVPPDYFFMNGAQTPPTTLVTSMTRTFTAPATPGTYEFRLFADNIGFTKLATSPTITVTSAPPPPPPVVSSVSVMSVNGGSAPITIPPGGTLTVGVQNGGTATAWAALYKTTDANYVPPDYFFMNGAQTPPTTLVTSMTRTFTAPATPGTYEFRLFANNMDFTRLATSPTVTVTPPPPTSGGCTSNCFYVSMSGDDSNSGTQAAPWRTITKAAKTLTAGQTAVVMDGTYTESTIRPVNSGTASQPIRIMAQNKWQAILSSTSGCQPGINLYVSYFIVEDMRITVAPNNVDCTIFTSTNAAIKAWQTQEPNINGPLSSGAQGFVARGNLIDFHASRTGAMKTNQDFSLIENNVVHSEIETFNSNSTIIRGNTLYDGGPNLTYIVTKGGARNNLVYNNVVHVKQGGARGIILGGTSGTQWLFDPASGVECYNCVAYNNVVINESGGQTPTPGLLGMSSCQDCVMMNNVGIGGQLYMQGRGNRNPTFKNNIMTCDHTGAATGGWNGWNGFWNGTLNVDYNNFYQCSSAEPGQSHAVVGDPQFVNPNSDWHLQTGSAASGAGDPVTVPAYGGGITDVSKNVDGVTRTAPWNLGIY